MGTKLYLRKETPSGSYPTAHYKTYSGDVVHNWPDTSQSYVMNTSVPAIYDEVGASGNFLVDPIPHDSQVRTFVSAPLKYPVTFSGNMTFSSKMGMSNLEEFTVWVYVDEPPPPHHEWVTFTRSTAVAPHLFFYSWNPSVGLRCTLSDVGPLGQFDYYAIKDYTYSTALSASTASAGDRLVFELHYYQWTPGSYSPWSGYSTEAYYYNTSNSFVSFSQNMEFGYQVSDSIGFKYNVKNRSASSKKFIYRLARWNVPRTLKSQYWINSYRYIELYMETNSTARGKASLKMSPRASLSLGVGVEDYSQKWVLPEPSLHKFKMIDDFEGYHDLIEASNYWTVSDGMVTFSALKSFPEENLSDYEILTFYATADQTTVIRAQFGDKYGNSSSEMRFYVTDKWQRYETLIPWNVADNRYITNFRITGDYAGYITVDDIFVLDYENETENIDWIKMNLTDIEFGRESKMSTFQIPFKQSETLQFLGEKNGEGQLKIKTLDSMQTEFFGEMMKTNTPLYVRYKNLGLPIVLRNTKRNILQIIPKQVSSDVTIPFYEIYDYSMW